MKKKELEKKSLELNKNIYEKLYASLENIDFVNFHKDEEIGNSFGNKELFKKIHDFFIKSDDYKNHLN